MIARTVREMESAGAAGIHIEDQVQSKRCGHRPGKALVAAGEMVDRVKAAVDARGDRRLRTHGPDGCVFGRGIDAAIDRAGRYVRAGADMIFAEAMTWLDEYRQFCAGGARSRCWQTSPSSGGRRCFHCERCGDGGGDAALPAVGVSGHERGGAGRLRIDPQPAHAKGLLVPLMQTREQLYEVLGYHAYEQKLDELFCRTDERMMRSNGNVSAPIDPHAATEISSRGASWRKKAGGLAGMVAGRTAICTVGKEGVGLTYRGYAIEDLAAEGDFEEVAYLLLYGELPDASRAVRLPGPARFAPRACPTPSRRCSKSLPAIGNPMDVMRTGCSMLGCLEPEQGHFARPAQLAERLLAVFPSILLYWHHFHRDGRRIETRRTTHRWPAISCTCCTAASRRTNHRRAMDVSLILYAEHEFNASTFTARIAASTLSDFYSAITAAIGTLRGPLHGGANEEAMELIDSFRRRRRGRDRHPPGAGAQGQDHGLRPPRLSRCPIRDRTIIQSWSRRLAEEGRRRPALLRSPSGSAGDVVREEAVPQPGLLQRHGVPLPGHPDAAVHAGLCDCRGPADGRRTCSSSGPTTA